MPGAFTKTIMENGPMSGQPRIKHLMNHSVNMPIGKLITLKEDSDGLPYESQIGTHTLGKDFLKMVESGLITEHSIGYRVMKKNQLQDYEDYNKNPAGGWFALTEVKLYEGSSLTAWGANPLTPITGLKGDINQIIERQKAIEKFCRNTDASDELIELLLIHSKQQSQQILDLQKATKPVDTTLPETDLKDAFTIFKNSLK
jgi:HK97 family phage prohead protease